MDLFLTNDDRLSQKVVSGIHFVNPLRSHRTDTRRICRARALFVDATLPPSLLTSNRILRTAVRSQPDGVGHTLTQ